VSSKEKPTRTDARLRALDLVGDRWTLWLLCEIDAGAGVRFSDLAGQDGLSRRVLTERLGRLVEEQLVAREPYSTRPLRHRYALTPRGAQLQRLALALLHVAGGGVLPPDASQVAPIEQLPEPERERERTEARPAQAVHSALPPAAELAHPSEQLLAADPDAARTIYEATVAVLVRYDEQYRTQLVETLETYLVCDASVSITASRLYAHRHTIRYRLGRVRELTGLDVDVLADRERLVLGLRALRMFQRAGT
jgi:DNA-binding PucR family transcriptional regulator